MMAESASFIRRNQPRVAVDSFCSEYVGDRERHGLIVDLSDGGLRIQRPLHGPLPRTVQLEFEIPEIDEVVWAQGEVCFDQLWQVPKDELRPSGLLRTSGLRLLGMASRHRRLIREYVTETWRRHRQDVSDADFMFASCYRFG